MRWRAPCHQLPAQQEAEDRLCYLGTFQSGTSPDNTVLH